MTQCARLAMIAGHHAHQWVFRWRKPVVAMEFANGLVVFHEGIDKAAAAKPQLP